MRWAALSRRHPILRGVSASQIRVDHAANHAGINARYGPALPSSPQLRGEADTEHHSAVYLVEGRHFGGGIGREGGFESKLERKFLCQRLILPLGEDQGFMTACSK
jgi:hypothetical protein